MKISRRLFFFWKGSLRFVLLVDVDVELLFRLFIFMKYFLIQLFHVEILFCLTMFSFCLEAYFMGDWNNLGEVLFSNFVCCYFAHKNMIMHDEEC